MPDHSSLHDGTDLGVEISRRAYSAKRNPSRKLKYMRRIPRLMRYPPP